jgi:hypothetical protein
MLFSLQLFISFLYIKGYHNERNQDSRQADCDEVILERRSIWKHIPTLSHVEQSKTAKYSRRWNTRRAPPKVAVIGFCLFVLPSQPRMPYNAI